MAGEWTTVPFGSMAQLVRDPIHPSKASGLPYIGLEHIGERSLSLLGTGVAEDATSLKSRFKRGDILFGKLRPYFRKVIRAPFDGICSTDVWVVRPRPGVNDRFLFYLLASDLFIEPVVRSSEGTKMPRAQWEYACSLELPLPPLPEQRAIAHILSTLDDKIELNRRMSATLEAMARALFKSWFVDFDPVRAKCRGDLDGRPRRRPDHNAGATHVGATHASPLQPGVITRPDQWPQHILALFPDRLVDSELGEIPEGWTVRPLGEVLELAYGKALKDRERRPGSVPVFGSNGQIGWHDERLATGPGIIVGRKGNPGTITWAPTDFFAIDTTFYVLPKKECPSLYFLFYALGVHDLSSLAADSAVPGLNRNFVYSNLQILPPVSVLEAFDYQVKTLFDRRYQNDAESRTLAALRDALLPKLISGELRVKDVERFLKERGL